MGNAAVHRSARTELAPPSSVGALGPVLPPTGKSVARTNGRGLDGQRLPRSARSPPVNIAACIVAFTFIMGWGVRAGAGIALVSQQRGVSASALGRSQSFTLPLISFDRTASASSTLDPAISHARADALRFEEPRCTEGHDGLVDKSRVVLVGRGNAEWNLGLPHARWIDSRRDANRPPRAGSAGRALCCGGGASRIRGLPFARALGVVSV